jgi:hypothetical protein
LRTDVEKLPTAAKKLYTDDVKLVIAKMKLPSAVVMLRTIMVNLLGFLVVCELFYCHSEVAHSC